MTADIVLQPMLPLWLVAALLAPALLLLVVAAARRGRGWALRGLVLLTLSVALLDPRIVSEQRRPRPDVAVLVIDESLSQKIGERPAATERAQAELQAALAKIDNLEVRVIRAGDDASGETRLFDAIERAVLDDASGRLAGVFVVSDGQVHDVPLPGGALWLSAPLHLLLTGRRGEFDRRIIVQQAPAFGLVDQRVEVTFRVESTGGAETDGGRAVVSWRVDGVVAGTIEVATNRSETVPLPITHAGPTVLELEVEPVAGEISTLNNRAAVVVNGVRERLRVLLVSGQPHPGERTWRNLLKSDPAVDLVHFTILRPPEKDDATPLKELSLIVFPVQELFENKLNDFDLVVLDRYVVRGILPTPYYGRIADYVRQGGALLVAVGPEFASAQSLFRTALGEILPASPTNRVIEKAFRPQVTELGRRHPVTSGLPGERASGDAEGDGGEGEPTWGRWFRFVDGRASSGSTLMTGGNGEPLLIVDRVGQGRVAQLMSDQMWLWARGFEGGGPQAELLRRLAHWLMKEPELEEEHLEAHVADGRLSVRRRSLDTGAADVRITDPAGATTTLRLDPGADGVARGDVAATLSGLWRVEDGVHTALAAAGRLDPPEFTDLRATADQLSPLVESTRGGITWIVDGLPSLRRVLPSRTAAGPGWLGVQRNQAYAVTGLVEVPLLPALLFLAAALGGLAGAWWREGQ